jgi:hypothetical protein
MSKRPGLVKTETPAKKRKVTVLVPTALKEKVPAAVIHDGYTMRQKSLWISDAIESLLNEPSWEGSLISDRALRPDDKDVLSFDPKLIQRMTQAVEVVQKENPGLKASISAIVRVAINRRLLGF